jgi:5-methylthioadenosine/S-adenosylhomocysteine deaminase
LTEIHSAPVVLPIVGPPIRDGAVAVENGRIVAVGPRAQMPPGDERRWDGILTPGLVNAHTHLNFTAYGDFYDNGKPFFPWIAGFPARNATMSPQDWADSSRAGCAELLRTGTTAAADVVTEPSVLTALHEAGLGGTAYFEVVGLDTAAWVERRAAWLGHLERVTHIGISPHTVYTLSTAVLKELGEIARDQKLRLHPHGSETLHEHEFTMTGTGPFAEFAQRFGLDFELTGCGSGRTPVHELDAAGLLGADSHIAHGVHCDAADRALLRARGTAVALCPRSNERLEAGEAPIAAYRAEGNPVAIGTDSRASAPSLDLLADVAAARRIALAQGSPEDGLDRWLVEAATLGGARAMGLEDQGALIPGNRADLAIFGVSGAGDPYRALATEGEGACIGTVLSGHIVHQT